MNKVLLWILVMLFCIASANAISFDNEEIHMGITDFSWCFDNPFGQEKAVMRQDWQLYITNKGCHLEKYNLYAVNKAPYYETECHNQPPKCSYKPTMTVNGTVDLYECTSQNQLCYDVLKYKTEYKDVVKNDMLLLEADRLCYKAKRKAKTGSQACDMNFRYDDGTTVFDVADYGKAWWNASFNSKWSINFTNNSAIPDQIQQPVSLDLYAGNITFADCDTNGEDVRILNSTEDGEIEFEIANWDKPGQRATLYINDSITNTTNLSIYLYCNASGLSSASVDIPILDNNENTNFYYNFDETSGSAIDQTGNGIDAVCNGNCPNHQAVPAVVRYSNNFIPANKDHYNTTPDPGINNANNFTINLWVQADDTNRKAYIFGNFTDANTYFYVQYQGDINDQILFYMKNGANVCSVSATNCITDNNWHMATFIKRGAKTEIWIDADNKTLATSTWTNCAAAVQPYEAFSIGHEVTTGSTRWWDGKIDEFQYVNNEPWSRQKILRAYNDSFTRTGLFGKTWPYYANTTTVFGTKEQNTQATQIQYGLFDDAFNNISWTVDEGQDFFVWANYSYSSNSTPVHPNGFCNWSADNIISEDYNRTLGLNTTVCTGGACTYINRTVEFTGLEEDNFIQDIYRFQLCHNGNVRRNYIISTSCNSSFEFDFTTLPLCTAGYLNLSIIDQNCSGRSAVNLSVWSAGAIPSQGLRLVDNFLGIDREHNHTGNLSWNAAEQLFISENEYEYYEHGSRNITVGCFSNVSGIDDKPNNIIQVIVVNVPPVNILSDIWTWFDGLQAFTNNIAVKYPLQNTLNISGECIDDDIANVTLYLNYSNNNTNIHTLILPATPPVLGGSVNYTQGNFSTNTSFLDGVFGYTFQSDCEDTTNNVSIVRRSFTARNLAPVASWSNASPVMTGRMPVDINFTCTDSEGESMNAYVYLNDTLNSSGNIRGVLANVTEGTYNYTVSCADSLRNGTNTSLILFYSPVCTVDLVSPCDGCRYQDDTVLLSFNCSNGLVIDSCSYSINDFANVTLNSCNVSVNITAERGWNRFTLNTLNSGIANTVSINFWAKSLDSSILDYPVIWFVFLVGIIFMVIAVLSRVTIFHFVAGVVFAFAGYELLAVSTMAGYLTIIVSLVYGLVMVLQEVFIA